MQCPSQIPGGVYTVAGMSAFENCNAGPEGLLAYPGYPIPDDKQYYITAVRNTPGNFVGATKKAGFVALCEACLRARGILYSKQSPGDCGSGSSPISGIGSGQIVGLSGQAASGVVGGLGAAGALSGAATFGIGTAVTFAVSAIEGIFQHHSQAVANEQGTICSVARYFNPLVQQIDAAVRSGEISAAQGVAYMKQVTNQAINGLQSILSGTNAASYFIGVLKAFADFANYLYPHIAPELSLSANDPGGAPDFYGTPPGGVNASSNTLTNSAPPPPIRSTAANTYAPAIPGSAPILTPNRLLPGLNTPDYLNRGYNQGTGQSEQAADVPPSINWVMIGAIAAVVAAFVALLAVVG
jgi:hypothetical protein